MNHSEETSDSVNVSDHVTIALRYSFTGQFLRGAALLAAQARVIEDDAGQDADLEQIETEYVAHVVAAVMQSVAALDAEVSEILLHGPGHHLGSNGIDNAAHDFLKPLRKMIDRQETLRRYELVLHLLKKQPLDTGGQMYESADLLVKLRNELVHYKSRWGQEMEGQRLVERLKDLGFEKPTFLANYTNFFPRQILSASCASWAVSTATNFIDAFYDLLGLPSPLEPHRGSLSSGPQIRYRN